MYKDNIKRILREKRISQKEFGKMVGYSQNMICYYLAGRSEPTISFFLKASEALDVPLEEICYGRNDNQDDTEHINANISSHDSKLNEIIRYYKQLTPTGKVQLYYSAQSFAVNPKLSNKNNLVE